MYCDSLLACAHLHCLANLFQMSVDLRKCICLHFRELHVLTLWNLRVPTFQSASNSCQLLPLSRRLRLGTEYKVCGQHQASEIFGLHLSSSWRQQIFLFHHESSAVRSRARNQDENRVLLKRKHPKIVTKHKMVAHYTPTHNTDRHTKSMHHSQIRFTRHGSQASRSPRGSGGCRSCARKTRCCRATLGDHAARRLVCVACPCVLGPYRDLCVICVSIANTFDPRVSQTWTSTCWKFEKRAMHGSAG